MPPITSVQDKRVTVLGLGHFGGGIAVSRWLVEQGARVVVADESTADKLVEPLGQLSDLPIEFHLGPEQDEADYTRADLVVASPAVPPSNPHLRAAAAAGVPVTTEICLFVQRCPAPVFGVTGTKGKSTTSTLLGRMLATRSRTWFGGNIGKSLLPDLPHIKPTDAVVLELSSFMLWHLGQMRWSPHVAIVTMLSEDHLDWHETTDAYVDAKRNIVRYQQATDVAVLNEEDPPAWGLRASTRARIVPCGAADRRFLALRLSGAHNQLNAQAAYAAAATAGVSWDDAQAAVADFRGLPHRLEVVHTEAGVQYVNDSIATIPQAAIAALGSFPSKHVIAIVGGSDKKRLPTGELTEALAKAAKAVLCVGETAEALRQAVLACPAAPPTYTCADIASAVAKARTIATPGDVVLLSPGHPSYDQFTNFQERGAAFTRAARGTDADGAPHAIP